VLCDFLTTKTADGYLHVCRVCGAKRRGTEPRWNRRCGDDWNHLAAAALHAAGHTRESLGLGDWLAKSLETVGITKELVGRLKGENGPCASCKKRQEWLNKLGQRIAAAAVGVAMTRGPGDPVSGPVSRPPCDASDG
jgi:hypothetical protein